MFSCLTHRAQHFLEHSRYTEVVFATVDDAQLSLLTLCACSFRTAKTSPLHVEVRTPGWAQAAGTGLSPSLILLQSIYVVLM